MISRQNFFVSTKDRWTNKTRHNFLDSLVMTCGLYIKCIVETLLIEKSCKQFFLLILSVRNEPKIRISNDEICYQLQRFFNRLQLIFHIYEHCSFCFIKATKSCALTVTPEIWSIRIAFRVWIKQKLFELQIQVMILFLNKYYSIL